MFQIIYSKLSDLLPAEVTAEDDPSLMRPATDDLQETTEKTRLALEKLTSSKIAAAMPVRCADKAVSAQKMYSKCYNYCDKYCDSVCSVACPYCPSS